MEKESDLNLICQAQAGDRRSFAELVDRYYTTVYRFAFKWCRVQEDAEDVTHEVFIKLAGNLHLFAHRSQFSTWLYRMTVNCAKDHARKNSRWGNRRSFGPLEDEQVMSPNPGPEAKALAGSIYRAIDQLPHKQKEAMLLVYAEGKDHKQAAAIIGCAETTVSWRIFKAKQKLRKVLS